MDVNTADPYEQKLYNMFKSFDIHSVDSLDKDSLTELCKMLELKDRGPKLVANLIHGKRNNRVTFPAFKEGLLNLLGNDVDDENYVDSSANGEFYHILKSIESHMNYLKDLRSMFNEAKFQNCFLLYLSLLIILASAIYNDAQRMHSVNVHVFYFENTISKLKNVREVFYLVFGSVMHCICIQKLFLNL